MTETILNISAMLRFCETRCISVIYDRSKALQIVFRNVCLPYLLLLVNDVRRFRERLVLHDMCASKCPSNNKKWIITIQWCYKPMFSHKLLRHERCDCAMNYTRNHTQRLIKIALMSSYGTHRCLNTNLHRNRSTKLIISRVEVRPWSSSHALAKPLITTWLHPTKTFITRNFHCHQWLKKQLLTPHDSN